MKQNNCVGILVVLEHENYEITELSRELLYKAARLSQGGEPVYGVIFLSEGESLNSNTVIPAKKIFVYQTNKSYESEFYKKLLCECIDEISPKIVLLGGTPMGKALASRIAVEYKTGVTADCTGLEITEEGLLLQTRPAFGGNIMADIITPVRRPQIATARRGIFLGEKPHLNQCKNFVKRKRNYLEDSYQILAAESVVKDVGIDKAKVLIAAGRGVKKKEDLELLEEVALRIGGKLACSRAVVEKGWLGSERQIGLSGKSVEPDLLITCGVSGSVQFMSGMKNSKCIVAINNDSQAPIFNVADYPILGDMYEIVPKLMERLEARE